MFSRVWQLRLMWMRIWLLKPQSVTLTEKLLNSVMAVILPLFCLNAHNVVVKLTHAMRFEETVSQNRRLT